MIMNNGSESVYIVAEDVSIEIEAGAELPFPTKRTRMVLSVQYSMLKAIAPLERRA